MVKPRSGLGLRSGYYSPQLDVEVRLNSNESSESLPEGFYQRLNQRVREVQINRYPDRSYHQVREALAERDGVSPQEVFAGNGSNEVLQTICLGFAGSGRTALVIEPTYAMHSQIARNTGANVEIRFRRNTHELTVGEYGNMLDEVQPDLTFLCSPNNPTGESLSSELLQVAASSEDRLVVFDEAYVEFSSKPWTRAELPNVVQTRTFSKAFAMAGARFGYCIAVPETIAVLDEVVLPYHLDSLKQALVLTSLEFIEQAESAVAEVIARRDRLSRSMTELGLDVYPSDANFLLVDFGEIDGNRIWEELVSASVLVRNCTSWPGLGNCLRITAGTEVEHERLLEALSRALVVVGS